MTCTRCAGLVHWERVHWRSRVFLLACLACGDRIDATILANRRWQATRETLPLRTRTWGTLVRLVEASEASAS